MNASDLLKWLGFSPEEPEFDKFLRSKRIYSRPCDENENDTEAADSLIDEVERSSVALIYEERLQYEKTFNPTGSLGRFILKQIAFYAESIHDYPGFKGTLPFDLCFTDTSEDTHRKLGPPSAARKVHGLLCDLYLIDDLNINISYVEATNRIGIIHIRRQHIYDQMSLKKLILEKNSLAIDIESLIKCLGLNSLDASITNALEPTGWKPSSRSSQLHEITELIKSNGLTLYFHPSTHSNQANRYPTLLGSTFTGFRINRRGDMQSNGFDGILPFNIEFYDTPDDVLKKMGTLPDSHWIGDDIGSFKWKLPHYILHVMFSLIDYQVYRISCFDISPHSLETAAAKTESVLH